jgi:hypothetical protein
MFALRAVAGFTGNARMLPGFLQVENVGVTAFADLMSRVDNRERGDFSSRIGTIVAELAEAPRHQEGTEPEEREDGHDGHRSQPHQMSGILHEQMERNSLSNRLGR